MIETITAQKITYLASLDKIKSPGVFKKILGTMEGAKSAGYSTEVVIVDTNPGFLKALVKKIDDSDAEVLLIRSICQYNFYLIPSFLRAKNKGKRIILDVPTPNKTAVTELLNGKNSWVRKLKDLTYLIVSGPIPYWFVSKVLQYAQEGSWFLLGNRRKTSVIGNGIQVTALPERREVPKFDGTRLNLIGVASLNYWHGFDRLIKAVSIFNSKAYRLKVYLNVVGKGEAFSDLQNLTTRLGAEKYVDFKGFLHGEDLFQMYNSAHLAVGSLALFRKNLGSASELKSREYCAVGIPFIAVGDDPDFPSSVGFRIELPNRESVEDLVDFFRDFDPECIAFSSKEIRDYAVKHLDFSTKVAEILKGN